MMLCRRQDFSLKRRNPLEPWVGGYTEGDQLDWFPLEQAENLSLDLGSPFMSPGLLLHLWLDHGGQNLIQVFVQCVQIFHSQLAFVLSEKVSRSRQSSPEARLVETEGRKEFTVHHLSPHLAICDHSGFSTVVTPRLGVLITAQVASGFTSGSVEDLPCSAPSP